MGARNPFQAREVTSRRGGPAKQPLSRDAIVTEALELLTREGLEGMSLRKVAAALDTGPASLYAYVENLQELRALVCDRALAGVDTASARAPAPGDGWQHRLIALLRSYLQVLAHSPGLAQLAMSTVAAGPNALRIIEALLSLLEEARVDRATAAWAVDLLLLYVTALAAEQSQRRDQPDPLGPIARVIGAVSPQEHPHTHAARDDLLSGGPERITWALQVLLKGILQTPRHSVTTDDSGAAARLSKPRKPARGR
ncbi:TetR/AcrR family transcriptional regulator [Sorangium sp. So ce1153]|uniref:TetR/AcrR family transcriptional regulator n=1 Tax=Sorangium sp. So ce1153 TaxID=3133333 RepID=UPI003F5FDE69